MNKTAGSTDTTPNETSTPSGSKPESSSEPTPLQSEGESMIAHDLEMEKSMLRRAKGRENVRDKAKRLLVSGRLRVVKVDGDLIIAECRGDSGGLYHLGRDPKAGQWRCTCEARTACSHLHALWAVTAVER